MTMSLLVLGTTLLLLLSCGPAASAVDWNQTGVALRQSVAALLSSIPASWESGQPPCSCPSEPTSACTSNWEGVACGTANEGITGFSLKGKGATGQPPGSWAGLLGNLSNLDLSNNNLNGSLPAEWSAFTDMTVLNLESNKLQGTLPPSWQNLGNLARLLLGQNHLTGTLPTNWSSLQQLSSLDLSEQIEGLHGELPDSWKSLTNLATLHLQQNHFWGNVPESWSKMQVATLRLGGNVGLCGPLPNWMAQPALENFIMNITATGLGSPCWITVLLNVRDRYFQGGILTTEDLLSCTERLECDGDHQLVQLNLGESALPILPPDFSALTTLTALYLGVNEASTSLPPAWSTLVNLRGIYAESQTIKGTLPPEWGSMTALTEINFGGNLLTGPIPSSWSSMPLVMLSLDNNRLTGPPPASLSTALEELALQQNQLSGPLPVGWSALTKLTSLEIQSNKFTGTLPAAWTAMKSLSQAYLGDNQLSGTIPEVWTAWTSLNLLRLLNNPALCGPLPSATPPWVVQSYNQPVPDDPPATVTVIDRTALNTACPVPPAPEGGLSGGAIAGIVIAVLVAVSLLAALVWCLIKRRSAPGAKHRLPFSSGPSAGAMGGQPWGGHGVTVVNTVQRPTFGAKPAPIGVGKRELEMELNSF